MRWSYRQMDNTSATDSGAPRSPATGAVCNPVTIPLNPMAAIATPVINLHPTRWPTAPLARH